jgi:small subunit ribosomal protein S8
MTDPIADMLTRIRNAYAVKQKVVNVPYSGIKAELAKVLKDLNYITDVHIVKNKDIIINLRYVNNQPTISAIKRVSKPGRRTYKKASEITPTLSGYGTTIISTSKGIMTGEAAKKAKIGGEVICRLW